MAEKYPFARLTIEVFVPVVAPPAWEIVIIIKLLPIALIIEVLLIKLQRDWIIIFSDIELGAITLWASQKS